MQINQSSAKEILKPAFAPLLRALAEGKQIQFFIGGNWLDCGVIDTSNPPCCYRIRPEPLEFWANVYNANSDGFAGYLYGTKEEADKAANSERIRCAHFKEVL